ncbi:hypothetical protein PN465_17730 [Nodularia spumigena CS-584]|uniref:Uncharacterized protein n=1 Tax=Nodularia spumigena UHCC 0060 TaxID=3110300 RepID=A0ABU5UVN2_NODSP|nr:hypothetical protein [Nodularia spumigena]AHJ31406.1 hypothetical protein NSP_51180 [Nodularia spumigena CCY9414]MDB9384041.1 hypothetical protein [Nodularia spumigena CS-584]MEA5526986.1 hypothetical protein [Nodularia spumigena UHCC 0143]MEA5558752.1 hypothetical protein [Nodularia spumigena CH309]MEA5609600.1 hypothetical protein [Nodularia spumigena UHCC 0060]
MSVSSEELALTDSETLEEVIKCLGENLAIETQGVCDQQTLFEILIKAASKCITFIVTFRFIINSSAWGI